MQGAKSVFLTVLKVLPLAIYIRSAACKFSIPVLGCETPLCPVAIGETPKGDLVGCTPTGAWNPPHFNLIIARAPNVCAGHARRISPLSEQRRRHTRCSLREPTTAPPPRWTQERCPRAY